MKQCTCKVCRYYRLFQKHLEKIPEESKPFFKQLYENYVMAEDEKDWLKSKIEKRFNADPVEDYNDDTEAK